MYASLMSTSGTSISGGGNTTPTNSTTIHPSLRMREVDEASIASDFSVIPESLVEAEGGVLGEERTFSTTSFLRSEDLQPSASAMESHSKVAFQDIQPTYYLDSDIAVSYTLGSNVTPKSSDRVGLYRVGFSSYQDYLDYQWAPAPTPDHTAHQLPLTVVFKASSFPKEVGEFFQFCYVTHEGQIVGVSAPFQLQRVGAAKEMCVVEEDGMVVVRSSESVLHERLNELNMQKERLVAEAKQTRTVKDEMGKQLQEKEQQLGLCQDHLQAVEVKLKQETSEKCELMGRIGQVVEEKGHLEDKLRTLERTLASERARATSLQDRATVGESRARELEEEMLASRKTQETTTLALRSLESDLTNTKETLKSTMQQLEEMKEEREKAVKELEFWTSTAEADQSEKNSLATKFSAVNEELIVKLEELEGRRTACITLEEKLNKALKELEEANGKVERLDGQVEGLEEEKSVHLEREEVVKQDNAHLQATIAALKDFITHLEEEKGNERKGREAAEKIACDLSGRLQAARSEYHNLALTNHKLAKKLKKLRQKGVAEAGVEGSGSNNTAADMTTSTASISSWLHAEVAEEDSGSDGDAFGDSIPGSLTQSCVTVAPTCCSHTTQQLSEVMHKKMEDIVRELSQQILSLKLQLQEKELRSSQPQQEGLGEEEEEEGRSVGEEGRGTEGGGESRTTEECEAREEPSATTQSCTSRTETVLYGNCFLPTAPTAPVFLPEGGNNTTAAPQPPVTTTTPTAPTGPVFLPEGGNNTTAAPQPPITTTTAPAAPVFLPEGGNTTAAPQPPVTTTPTDPTPAPPAHYYLPRVPPIPQHPPTTAPNGTSFLPPPLQPETTPTARQAAVLSQFAQQQQQQQQQQPSAPPVPGHESDDDDFHSTSDSDTPVTSPPPFPAPPLPATTAASTPLSSQQHRQSGLNISPGTSPTSALLDCPLCNLCFPVGTLRLLEEHINSHLEHVCPVCSEVFQRNCQDKFQEHVHSHFEEEEAAEEEHQRRAAADPSGPWDAQPRSAYLLEID